MSQILFIKGRIIEVKQTEAERLGQIIKEQKVAYKAFIVTAIFYATVQGFVYGLFFYDGLFVNNVGIYIASVIIGTIVYMGLFKMEINYT